MRAGSTVKGPPSATGVPRIPKSFPPSVSLRVRQSPTRIVPAPPGASSSFPLTQWSLPFAPSLSTRHASLSACAPEFFTATSTEPKRDKSQVPSGAMIATPGH